MLLLSQLQQGQVVLAGTQLLRQRLELGTAVADMPTGLQAAAAKGTATAVITLLYDIIHMLSTCSTWSRQYQRKRRQLDARALLASSVWLAPGGRDLTLQWVQMSTPQAPQLLLPRQFCILSRLMKAEQLLLGQNILCTASCSSMRASSSCKQRDSRAGSNSLVSGYWLQRCDAWLWRCTALALWHRAVLR